MLTRPSIAVIGAVSISLAATCFNPTSAQSRRPLAPDDIFEFETVGGEADMNVPILGGQQLYQGLKRLGRETELVIYPGENHSIRRPSFQKDRFERYLARYSKYLKPAARTSSQ
jgi:hypothetical protein